MGTFVIDWSEKCHSLHFHTFYNITKIQDENANVLFIFFPQKSLSNPYLLSNFQKINILVNAKESYHVE